MRVLLVSCLLAAVALSGVSARLQAEFTTQGLEQLEGRYGAAYPGYAGMNVGGLNYGNYGIGGLQQQQQFGTIGGFRNVGFGNVGVLGGNVGNFGVGAIPAIPTLGLATPAVGLSGMYGNVGMNQMDFNQDGLADAMPNYATVGLGSTTTLGAAGLNLAQPMFGGLGAFGAGAAGTSKKTTVAAPIYAQSMVVPKIITQPILRPHMVQQPIVQQQLIQQPIVETRQVIQPMIRRIITQPIIRPEIYESTTIQPTLKTETTVQPHIIQQTVVTPTMSNQYEEVAPIQEAARTQVAPSQVLPVQSAKKGQTGLGLGRLY